MTRPDLPPIDHARRIGDVVDHLTDSACDALLLTDLADIRWLTGFGGSNGWVVVRGGEVVLGTDGRYGDRAREETAQAGAVVVAEQQRERLQERLLETLAGADEVALDASSTSHAEWGRLATDLPLRPTPPVVRTLRQVKDDAEIARIEAAAESADAALGEVEPILLGTADAPVTEADVRTELEYRMRLHGADDRSYATIVASGPDHAGRPHHEVSSRHIVEGDTVIIDVGGLVDGYHSDMTRSWVIGAASDHQREVYGLVERSQQAGLDAVRGGLAARDLDAVCRDVFTDAGYGDWFVHGTGHGVGLQIHEVPFHSAASEDVLRTGSVVTVEPGLYRGGFGGFRIEDLVVVTEDGHRLLTHFPKRPL